MCRSIEERKVLRKPATVSTESRNVASENEEAHALKGLTEGECAATDDDPESVEFECGVEPADWKVRLGPRNTTRPGRRERNTQPHTPFKDCTRTA